MKQLLQNLRSGETKVVDVPVPSPQPGEVLVQTCASLVSAGTERMVVEFAQKNLVGKARSRPDQVRQVLDKARREGLLTTLDAVFNRLDQPMPLGYSSAGIVVAAGEDVQGFSSGQRVACAGGNYAVHAEYVTVPTNLVTPLPDEVSFEAAAFTTLGAIAMHGFRLAESQVGARVAVIGLGLLGLLAASIARAAGCAVLGVDLDPSRIHLGEKLGIQAVLRDQAEEAASAFSRGRGCDAVLICADTSGNDPVELAGQIARDRARVVALGAVGLHIPRKLYFEKELTFINSRSYGPGRYDPNYEEGGHDYPLGYVRWTEGRNMEAFVDLLASGRLDVEPLSSHRFPIERAPEAYELITGKRKEPFLGVLLIYPQPAQEEPGSLAEKQTVSLLKKPRQLGKPVQLGVLGAGSFANAVMLPAIRKVSGVQLIGVASASGANAHHAGGRFEFQYAASDEQKILQDPDINTVAILTRHHLHARQVIQALQTGKHVFCEKPLAISEDELLEIEQALGKATSLLTVGFNRRFAPLACRLKAFFEKRSEPLFAAYRVNAGYLPLSHWLHDPAQGGGRIIGEGCHFIDFLSFLVGQPPLTVTAHGLPDSGRYREDNVMLTFGFADGSVGTVTYLANGDKAFPKERVEVFSSGMAAALDDFRTLELTSKGRRPAPVRSMLRQDKGHQAEWDAFTAAVAAGGPPTIPYEHLFGVTRATFAALQALRSGQTVQIGARR